MCDHEVGKQSVAPVLSVRHYTNRTFYVKRCNIGETPKRVWKDFYPFTVPDSCFTCATLVVLSKKLRRFSTGLGHFPPILFVLQCFEKFTERERLSVQFQWNFRTGIANHVHGAIFGN